MVAATARASGQVASIREMSKYPTARPASTTSMVFRRPNLSETQPPPGRAAMVMVAKPAEMRPALMGDRPKVSAKNPGSIETTASSEPKVIR